jgi:hypothetical protein
MTASAMELLMKRVSRPGSPRAWFSNDGTQK